MNRTPLAVCSSLILVIAHLLMRDRPGLVHHQRTHGDLKTLLTLDYRKGILWIVRFLTLDFPELNFGFPEY